MQKEKARSRHQIKALEDELGRMKTMQEALNRKIKASNEVSCVCVCVCVCVHECKYARARTDERANVCVRVCVCLFNINSKVRLLWRDKTCPAHT